MCRLVPVLDLADPPTGTARKWPPTLLHLKPPPLPPQVQQALSRQRFTLSEATPGDNVTVMIITLRPLPAIPRTSASRLNLRNCASSSDLLGPAGSSTELTRSRNLTADDS